MQDEPPPSPRPTPSLRHSGTHHCDSSHSILAFAVQSFSLPCCRLLMSRCFGSRPEWSRGHPGHHRLMHDNIGRCRLVGAHTRASDRQSEELWHIVVKPKSLYSTATALLVGDHGLIVRVVGTGSVEVRAEAATDAVVEHTAGAGLTAWVVRTTTVATLPPSRSISLNIASVVGF